MQITNWIPEREIRAEQNVLSHDGRASPDAVVFIENFCRLRQKNSTKCQSQMDIQAMYAILLKIFAVCARKIQCKEKWYGRNQT